MWLSSKVSRHHWLDTLVFWPASSPKEKSRRSSKVITGDVTFSTTRGGAFLSPGHSLINHYLRRHVTFNYHMWLTLKTSRITLDAVPVSHTLTPQNMARRYVTYHLDDVHNRENSYYRDYPYVYSRDYRYPSVSGRDYPYVYNPYPRDNLYGRNRLYNRHGKGNVVYPAGRNMIGYSRGILMRPNEVRLQGLSRKVTDCFTAINTRHYRGFTHACRVRP